MPPSAIECEAKEDLEFLYNIKSEGGENIHTKDSIYHGMRRNSSFADYFEGDLSQNLLSRRHFQLIYNDDRTPNEAASEKQIINGQLADQIKSESQRCANSATSDGKLGKLSEVNICSRKYFYHYTSLANRSSEGIGFSQSPAKQQQEKCC